MFKIAFQNDQTGIIVGKKLEGDYDSGGKENRRHSGRK